MSKISKFWKKLIQFLSVFISNSGSNDITETIPVQKIADYSELKQQYQLSAFWTINDQESEQ